MILLRPLAISAAAFLFATSLNSWASGASADLIFHNAQVWSADDSVRQAEAVAIRGNHILAVGPDEAVLRTRGPDTQVVDVGQRLIVPGFIDGHTHFENATEWFFEARLMDIDTQDGMLDRLQEAVRRVPEGLWITGGDWGEVAARLAHKRGETEFTSFIPDLAIIDAASPNHPVLFRRHDGNYFANSEALKVLRIDRNTPDPGGGSYVHDPESGELTGMLMRRAGDRAALALPPKSMARTLIAARAIVKELNQFGITTIHDIARVAELSELQIYNTHAERSYTDMNIFNNLRNEKSLSVRVYPLLALDSWEGLKGFGISPGSGDELIHYGALKSFIDGSLMFEPFNNRPNYSGDFTFRVQSPETTHKNFLGADRAGYDNATHMIGDKAISLYLDWLEEAIAQNGARDRRPRMIHMEYPRFSDIRRAGNLKAFADITPIHMLMDVKDVETKLGNERAKSAFTGRTLIDNGVLINLVSDWPGDYYKITAKPVNPLENIFMAVARRYPAETVDASWHPEEGLTIEEGLQAYTINPAHAAHEEAIKGSITPGKLADLVVLSENILDESPEKLLTTKVLLTVFDGRIVYKSENWLP